ncbi:MAG: dipeptidase [Anaerolineaceae bacterium]|nr:dipeptidase [Anaerolineaceae bacterium]
MPDALALARDSHDLALRQLMELAAIPSVGTDPVHRQDTLRAARWLADEMGTVGLQQVDILPTGGNPVVYGEWLGAGGDAATVLLYAHYDVQPARREDGWNSEPFEPQLRDGRLFGRGVADDKSHCVVLLRAVAALLASEEGCPVNVRFLLEGEEESGSPNLLPFLRENRERLEADAAIIADGGFEDPDVPLIVTALRGIVALELGVSGPGTDLHSGIHGGIVHNPAQVIAEIVARLHHPDGRIAVPGFYDDVRQLSTRERELLAEGDMSDEDWQDLVGAPRDWGEPGYSRVERTGARPTLEINGIYGGYSGEGFKTVIPARAHAKISCRLVANQRPLRVYDLVCDFIRTIAPPTVTPEFRLLGSGDPVEIDIDSPFVMALQRAYTLHWPGPAGFRRTGGSVPIIAMFSEVPGIPSVTLGFSTSDSGIHGPNENYRVDMLNKGIDTTVRFLQEIARGHQAGN